MRSFIVFCLVAVAHADKLGYNYQPVHHSSSGLSFVSGSSGPAPAADPSNSNPISAPSGISSHGSYSGHHAPSFAAAAGPSSSGVISSQFSGLSSASSGVGSSAGQSAPASAPAPSTPISSASDYEKEFFSFNAPDIPDEHSGLAQQIATNLKKHLRVIFIKGPENQGLENAAAALAQSAGEQKTAIYVLHKQADISQLANHLNNGGNNNNQRPEVHFVKYRTPEDAANAQRAIQNQYDSLGGTSHSHNAEQAPLLNFASPVSIPGITPQQPKNAYLPAAVFRF